MPSAQGIRAGRAFVELFGDDSKLVRCLNSAQTKVKDFGKSIMSFGTKLMAGGMALAAPLVGAVKTFTDYGSKILEVSWRTGMSVESLSELGYAANQVGIDIESMETGIRRMSKVLKGADDESKSAQEKLAQLGLSIERLEGLNPEQQFEAIAGAMSRIEDPTRKMAVAMEIFGKSGTNLIPLMDQFHDLRQEAKHLGLTLSTADAISAHALGDAFTALWATVRSGSVAIGSALAPALTKTIRGASEWIAKLVTWIRKNKELVITFAKVAAGVVAAGAAIIGLGTIVYGVSIAFGILSSIAAGVGMAVTGVATVLGMVGAMLGAILSPLGLVVAGITALAGYFLYTGQVGDYVGGVIGWMGEMFGYLKDVALRSWNAITSAIASGDIGAAMNVAWTTIKMLWQEGIGWLMGKWIAFKGYFLQVWNEAVYGTAMLMTSAWAGMQRTWVSVVSFMKKIWSQFTTWAANTWNSMQQSVGGVFIDALAKIGVLSDEEAKWAKQDMNKSLADKKKNRTKDSQNYIAEIDAEEERRKAGINQQESASLDALTSDMLAKDDARKKQLTADLAASKEAADAAKQEWEKSLAAATASGNMPDGKKPPKKPGQYGDFEGIDITGKSKSEVVGTFNPFVLGGLGAGGNYAEKTATACDAMRKSLRRMETEGIKLIATS